MIRYGFRDRLSAAFPSQVIVDATEFCNLACIHCPHPDFKASSAFSGRNLDEGLHRKMVDEVREYGAGITRYIRYTSNGEPLMHPRIYDMLETSVRHSGTLVTLTTNGSVLNERRMERILASGLHLVDVSIDAFSPEAYRAVRVGGDLEVTRRNVLRLLALARGAGSSTRIVVSFVEQPQNTHEVGDFERFWRDQGVDEVVVRRLHSAAGAVVSIASLLRAQPSGVERYPCLYPWERVLLNPRGELAFCPQDWVHGSVLADYRTTSIVELWRGEQYARLREAHLCGRFDDHRFCGDCPDWQQTRWPGEGRSYADLVETLKHA
jgi:MoaA/NifB/PqqE/SkfB family radical SAM enzyme